MDGYMPDDCRECKLCGSPYYGPYCNCETKETQPIVTDKMVEIAAKRIAVYHDNDGMGWMIYKAAARDALEAALNQGGDK